MLSAERNAAANTRSAYKRDLEDAAKFMASRRVTLGDTATADLSAYLAALDKTRLGGAEQRAASSALRQFFKFLVAEQIRSEDPQPRSTGRSSAVRCRSCWTKTRWCG